MCNDDREARVQALRNLYKGNAETLASFDEYLRMADWLEAELIAKLTEQSETVN